MEVDETFENPDDFSKNGAESKNPYEAIILSQNVESEENMMCDVCQDEDDYEGDELVICELCCVAVHQSCYGSELKNGIPEGPWFCARCRELKADQSKKAEDIRCFLCPDLDGCMKQVRQKGIKENSNQKLFAHIICVNWTSELWFADEAKEVIDGQLLANRLLNRCLRCFKKYGSVITCDYQNCTKNYHVRCAARMNLIKQWEEQADDLNLGQFDT